MNRTEASIRCVRTATGALCAALLVACQAPLLPDPVVDRVEPAFAYNGDDETVTIIGRNFYPQLAIDAWLEAPDVDPAFRAWLLGPIGGIPLARELVGVVILDDTHLTATVEAGLPAGVYDIEVESPAGRRGRGVHAFTVTDEQAVQLVLDTPAPIVSVTEAADVTVTLADIGGNKVPGRFEVAVLATLATGEGALEFDAGTLQDAEPTIDGDGLHGFLQDGEATVHVRSPVPSLVTVVAVPWDPESPIVGDSLDLSFEPGDDLHVEIALPSAETFPSFPACAPLTVIAQVVDQYDNAVAGTYPVIFRTECSLAAASVELDGPTPVEIEPVRATDASCTQDRVEVWIGPPGESRPFAVVAGPADHFAAVVTPTRSLAGDQVAALVDPQDACNNHAAWTGTVSVQDSLGGMIDGTCDGTGAYFCLSVVTRAGVGLVATVTGDDGMTGLSNAFDVLPDDVPGSASAFAPAVAAAGAPINVGVTVADAWGNPMDAALLGLDAIVVDDDRHEVTCELEGFTAGIAQLSCVLYTARSGAQLVASIPGFGVESEPVSIDVFNGPLAVVHFSGEATVTAGASLQLTVDGEDEFGNPYVVQYDPTVELADDSGTVAPASVSLGPTGSATFGAVFTRAGSTVVHALDGGVEIGASAPILVLAAQTSALRTTPAEPWAWVGEPMEIAVESVDAYGNRTDWSGTATLSSLETGASPVPVGLVNGIGSASFLWPTDAFVDTLEASGGGYVGDQPMAVSTRCAVGGPALDVSFGGAGVALVCLDPATGAGTVTADLSGSTPGAALLAGYGLAELGGIALTTTNPLLDMELRGAGRHPMRALVVDGAGCGVEADVEGWAGPDDGTPVGPLALSATDSVISVFDTTTVEVAGAVDCSGDPASFQELELRTTAGALLGPVASGAGLLMTLDHDGDGAATLTTAGDLSDGTLEVHATVESGAAAGVLFVDVTGDNLRPTVIAQSPSGETDQSVSSVSLVFSEPLLASSVVPANFAVTGPSVVAVAGATQVGSTVTLALGAPADGTAGIWTVRATSSLRDVAGNKLAGDWGAGAADYLGAFGATGSGPAALTCTAFDPPGLAFVPDGDPGAGSEADVFAIDLSSATAPAWWVVEVRDVADAVVWHERVVPAAASDVVTWGARDLAGFIVPNGTWRVSTWPDDGLGGSGTGCEVTVTVANPSGASP